MDTIENYRQYIAEAKRSGTWTKAAIDALIQLNDKAVQRAVCKLYELQTADEQQAEITRHSNGKGFAAGDAEIFSSFAKQINRGHDLTQRQLAICRKPGKKGYARLSKYWSQIVGMIIEKREGDSA